MPVKHNNNLSFLETYLVLVRPDLTALGGVVDSASLKEEKIRIYLSKWRTNYYRNLSTLGC